MLLSFDIRKADIYILCFIILHIFEIYLGKWTNQLYILKYDKVLDTICPIFLIIIFFIEKKISKKKKKLRVRMLFKNIFTENKKKKNLKNIILIICSICFYIIYHYISDNLIDSEEEIEIYLVIISLFIISRIFEKTFYSHHKLSIIINLILICHNFYENIGNLKIELFYIIFGCYCLAFYLSLLKYINTNFFTNIFLLRSIHSIFELIYRIIIYKDLKKFNYNYYTIIIIIEKLIHVFLETIIILKLGTIQSVISESVARFIPIIYMKLTNFNYFKKQYNIVSFGISLISSLIFLEIIQLNFCGLNKNTRKEITERSRNMNYYLDDLNLNSGNDSKEIDNFLFDKEKNSNI